MLHKASLFSRLGAFLRSCLVWDKAFTKNVLILALPMVLQELMSASLHILDGRMVSGLGDAAYSAVMQANRFSFLFQLIVFGTSTGSAIFLSQHWGVRDVPRMRHAMGLALGASSLLALLFAGTAMLFPRQIISLFLEEGESFELAVQFLPTVAPSYVFIALSNVYASAIRAAEKTYIPMIAGISGIASNTLLNYLLIHGNLGFPAMGVKGAATATVIATALTLGVNVAFAYGKKLPAGAKPRELFCRDRLFIIKFVNTVLPVIFNEALWAMGVTMYGIFYGRMGDAAVAAIGVNGTISELMWVPVFGITNAAAIIVGKTIGQGDRDRAYLYSKRLLAGMTAVGLLIGLTMLVMHSPLVGLYEGLSQAVRDKATLLLIISSLLIWVRAFNCVIVVGLFRSGGDTVYSLALDAGSMWVIGVPATAIAALVLHWPIELVFLCTMLDEVAKLFIGIPHFRKKKWMRVLTQ